jgi:anaerobic carbon-monoxide dehydrogenase iron sulfur subunit
MEQQFEYIVCDSDRCIGCAQCELACSITKHKVFDPALSRIRNLRIEPVVTVSIACRKCSDPPCVLACPRNALTQDPETGTIQIDPDMCDGCGWCVEACDFGAVLHNPQTKKVEMCDMCAELSEPQCVKFCPKDALYVGMPDNVSQRMRREALAKLLKQPLGGRQSS